VAEFPVRAEKLHGATPPWVLLN